MRVVYIAHPYGGLAENRERAKRWFKWAAVTMRVSPVADWILMTEMLDESNREFGLECDCALVERCDEVWLVGGQVSPGMLVELRSAKAYRDLTSLGHEPPGAPVDLENFKFYEALVRETSTLDGDALRKENAILQAIVDTQKKLIKSLEKTSGTGIAAALERWNNGG